MKSQSNDTMDMKDLFAELDQEMYDKANTQEQKDKDAAIIAAVIAKGEAQLARLEKAGQVEWNSIEEEEDDDDSEE